MEFVWSKHLPMSIIPSMTLAEFARKLNSLRLDQNKPKTRPEIGPLQVATRS